MKKNIFPLTVFLICWSAGMTFIADIPLLKSTTGKEHFHIKIRRKPAFTAAQKNTAPNFQY